MQNLWEYYEKVEDDDFEKEEMLRISIQYQLVKCAEELSEIMVFIFSFTLNSNNYILFLILRI
jgi:hypothetical protein